MSLICEDLAVELFKEVQSLKLQNPIKDQLRRASLSIALNLAEGAGRSSKRDQKRFYSIALGSLRETQALVNIIGNRELIKKYDRLGGLVYCLRRA